MSAINDGGSAFPSHGSMGEVAQSGMPLCDYLAAKAMQGLAANQRFNVTRQIENVAREAYLIADAMLAARTA